MSPNDVGFLIAVGIRALIEECWQRKILLTGIIKDSASRYLTRNYLGVMKQLGQQGYPDIATLDVRQLPWTDRIFLELLPLADETLTAPWSEYTELLLDQLVNLDEGFIVNIGAQTTPELLQRTEPVRRRPTTKTCGRPPLTSSTLRCCLRP